MKQHLELRKRVNVFVYTKHSITFARFVMLLMLIVASARAVRASGVSENNLADSQTQPGQIASPAIQEFHFFSAEQGWLLINKHLYWTKTGGQIWTNITPTNLIGASIEAVSFIDINTGWII